MGPMPLLAFAPTGTFMAGFRFPLLAGAIAMAVSWLLTPYVRALAIRKGAIDDPSQDDRRVHKEPTPRWGGIAIYGGFVASLLLVLPVANPHAPFPNYLIGLVVLGAAV